MTGAWAGAGYGGRGLVAGLRVGLACGVLLLPGFGVSSSSPQLPGHPTSICDAGVKGAKIWNSLPTILNDIKSKNIFRKKTKQFIQQ